MKDTDGDELSLVDMEWGVLPTCIQDPNLKDDRRRSIVNERRSGWCKGKSRKFCNAYTSYK